MIRKNIIQSKLKEAKMTQAELAEKMGIDPATLSVKLSKENGERLTVEEATNIGRILHIEKKALTDIFFGEYLAYPQE